MERSGVKMLGNVKDDIVEVYESRNILKSLVVKNLVGRYRNSLLGFTWHFIVPLILLGVYYVVFSQIRAVPIPDFWIYLAAGIFPFNFMVNNLTSGASCVVENANLIKKMYFPREIIVLSQVISTFVIMMIGYVIVLTAVVLSGYGVSISILLLPVIFIVTFIFTTGYVLVVSAATVYVRDIQYFLSSITLIFFFLTPMYFIADSVTGVFSIIVTVNPFTYFIEAYHDIIYYQMVPDLTTMLMVVLLSSISLLVGVFVFKKLKVGFAERL